MLAAQKDAEGVARQLLEKGCKLNIKGATCGTAMEVARKNGSDKVASMIRERYDERARRTEGREQSVPTDVHQLEIPKDTSDSREAEELRKMLFEGPPSARRSLVTQPIKSALRDGRFSATIKDKKSVGRRPATAPVKHVKIADVPLYEPKQAQPEKTAVQTVAVSQQRKVQAVIKRTR